MSSTKKIMEAVATVCLLFGTSSAAIAQVVDCELHRSGTISGESLDGVVVEFGDDCTIVGSVIGAAGIRANRASTFRLLGSAVIGGDVRVRESGTAVVLGNLIDGGDIVMRSNTITRVNQNTVVGGGSLRVVDDPGHASQWAEVLANDVTGDIRVNGNLSADVKNNQTKGGNITCNNNENLDAAGNVSLGGRTNCSRDLFPQVTP